MATLERVDAAQGSTGSRLVDEVLQMSSEEMAARIEQARSTSPAEAVERQRVERRARAERAAARFRAA